MCAPAALEEAVLRQETGVINLQEFRRHKGTVDILFLNPDLSTSMVVELSLMGLGFRVGVLGVVYRTPKIKIDTLSLVHCSFSTVNFMVTIKLRV